MNIIVTNKYKDLIYSTNIEILKELNGVFKVSQIANSFNSIFYKKIIIDATALEDFPKENVLKELSNSFDMDKLILFLPPDNPPPKNFLSFLVNINIYNFTDNPQGLIELVKKSNTINEVKGYSTVNKTKGENIKEDDSKNNDLFNEFTQSRVCLGFINITDNLYSTKLIYMLKKNLEEIHKKQVLGVEVDKNDFKFYNTSNMYSISSNRINEFLNLNQNVDVILMDIKMNMESFCDNTIYLVDPSLFEINKLLFQDRMAFQKLKGKKIIFVNSLLTNQDVEQFAKEANISVYYNLPPLNDRIQNKELDNLLIKLGIINENNNNNKPVKKGLFDFFK